MGHELTALAAVEGCRHAHLDAELIGFVSLAFPDALDLGRMQRINLPTALALALILHPASERERQREDLGKLGPAGNLADEVADDAPEHGPNAPQGPVRALELLGVGVALVPDQRDLAHPHIGLAQHDAVLLGQAHQALAGPMPQLGVGRKGDRFLLHGCVDDDPPEGR
jgi:hypothetical protein